MKTNNLLNLLSTNVNIIRIFIFHVYQSISINTTHWHSDSQPAANNQTQAALACPSSWQKQHLRLFLKAKREDWINIRIWLFHLTQHLLLWKCRCILKINQEHFSSESVARGSQNHPNIYLVKHSQILPGFVFPVCKVRSKMTEKVLNFFLNIHKSYYKHFHCLDLLLPHEVTVQHENISLVKIKLCSLCETSIISVKIKASTVCFNLFDEPMGFLMILWSFNFIKLYRKTHLLVLCGLCMQNCVLCHLSFTCLGLLSDRFRGNSLFPVLMAL